MPKLNDKQKKEKFNRLEKVAAVRGGRPLFNEWPGAKTKVQWECSCGHVWSAKPNSILNGTWCPSCSSGLSERICRELFDRLFSCQFEKIRPSWLYRTDIFKITNSDFDKLVIERYGKDTADKLGYKFSEAL